MKFLKYAAVAVVVAVLGIAGVAGAGLLMGKQRAARHIELNVAAVALRTDPAAVDRGRYLYTSRGCVDCHGADGGGATLAEDDSGLKLAGPNLTTGNPRMVAYQPVDWARSIRHGVNPEARPLRLMPSEDYNRLTDDDLVSIVAYVQQLPARQGNEHGTIDLPLVPRILYGFGLIPEAVTKIDHSLASAEPVPDGITVEHGRYVAQMCAGCHGPQLEGGKIAGAPPDWPAAARLAPGSDSAMPHYQSELDFIAMMRSGRRPDGSAIAVMPFSSLKAMNDTDLRALYLYLKRPGPG